MRSLSPTGGAHVTASPISSTTLSVERTHGTQSVQRRPDLYVVPRGMSMSRQIAPESGLLLIIDADATVRDMHSAFLRERGYRVWGAASADEAQSMIAYKLPEIVLLEISLPGMNGINLIRALRQRRRTTLLPIIIVSELATPRDIRNGLSAGADDYVGKPVDLGVLEARISALLRRDARLRQSLMAPMAASVQPFSMAAEMN